MHEQTLQRPLYLVSRVVGSPLTVAEHRAPTRAPGP
jgi:hypothetical protein